MLSKRLEAILNLVPEQARMADIGCDHAYLPIQLVRYHRVVRAIGCDINQAPLDGARANLQRMNIDKSKIELRLGSGFQPILPGEIDVATIAGMGGSLMVDILDDGAAIVKELKRLILSPNVAAWRLREWAVANQFSIVEEQLIEENGRYYELLCLEPAAASVCYTPVEIYFGPHLLKKKDAVTSAYFECRKQSDEGLMTQWKALLSEHPEIKSQYERYQKLWREWEVYQ